MKPRILILSLLIPLRSAIAQVDGGELDFGEVNPATVQSTTMQHPHATVAILIGLGVIALTIGFVALALFGRHRGTPFNYRLRQLPLSGRVLITFFVLIMGLVHIFALLEVYLQTRVTWSSTTEYFFYMKPTKLAGTTHAHLFGHATMYSLVAGIFLFTGLGEVLKTLALSSAIVGGLWDVTSWWLIKYAGGQFEALSVLTGAMASLGFLVMGVAILHEIWLTKETAVNAS